MYAYLVVISVLLFVVKPVLLYLQEYSEKKTNKLGLLIIKGLANGPPQRALTFYVNKDIFHFYSNIFLSINKLLQVIAQCSFTRVLSTVLVGLEILELGHPNFFKFSSVSHLDSAFTLKSLRKTNFHFNKMLEENKHIVRVYKFLNSYNAVHRIISSINYKYKVLYCIIYKT